MQIYPNPAMGHVRVTSLGEGIDRVELFSMDGKVRSSVWIPQGLSTMLIELGRPDAGCSLLKAGKERQVLIIRKHFFLPSVWEKR